MNLICKNNEKCLNQKYDSQLQTMTCGYEFAEDCIYCAEFNIEKDKNSLECPVCKYVYQTEEEFIEIMTNHNFYIYNSEKKDFPWLDDTIEVRLLACPKCGSVKFVE